jgi:hypothetical protein
MTNPLNMESDAEAAALTAKWTILALEAKAHRSVREYLLGDTAALARIRALDNQIAALRAQLT